MARFNPSADDFVFMLVEIDSIMMFVPGGGRTEAPALRLYGVTEAGHSALVFVHGFLPYFYVAVWDGVTSREISDFTAALDTRLVTCQANRKRRERCVARVEKVKRQSIW
eukprot:389141_1